MKNPTLTTICLFLNILTGVCQIKTFSPVVGTRLILELPSEFKEDRNIPGFRSDLDSSIITVFEVENPYTFDDLVQKRISNSLSLGLDTSNFRKSTYDGYQSVQFNTYDPWLHQKGFSINFGSDDFLVDISITTSEARMAALEKIVLKGKYNKNLPIKSDSLLGFTVSYEGTNQIVSKKDANTINTREKDQLGNVVSWLNLTRMPKSYFEGLSAEGAIDAMNKIYHFDYSMGTAESLLIDDTNFLWKLYTIDHGTFQEYKIIGIFQKKEFDLLAMGGGNSKEKLAGIYGIIKSIKFIN